MKKKLFNLSRPIFVWMLIFFTAYPTLIFPQASNPILELASRAAGYVPYQEPDFLTFDELKRLYENPSPEGRLKEKLERLWKTPIINNQAYIQGAKPHAPKDPRLGPYLRLASWNIEKSIHMERVIKLFTSEADFRQMVDSGSVPVESEKYKEIERQRQKLLNADIIVLQEMDIGVKRSDYLNAAAELAKALKMNYAYGPEQLEIDPVMLGIDKILLEDGQVDQEAMDYYVVDPARYKGVFGSAVLSRYPIKHVEVFQLEHQAYDWYNGEKKQTTFLEKSRRFGSKTVFKNEITREMKVGGRIYFRVDLEVPELPEGTLTIINIHLEIKCEPKGREYQISEILSYMRGIKHPVIMVGDFNSGSHDMSPTSVSREAGRAVKNPTNWLQAAVTYLSPYGLVINTTRGASNITKNFQDPTSRDIPVIAPNPVKGLFEIIENFRSDNGMAFDFRGDHERSINGDDGTLANSNQRDLKGFKTTFQVKRPVGALIGKYRLDWVFVKSYLQHPKDKNGSYRFAPHYGETLEEMNMSLTEPLSDHHPNVVDLPFEEPKI
ncbi:MAG TPA: endonuclease/exonuclease/phosphatase family protein [bacterium]|nr:endonuclease/exonuclease/phosphatase family protein [bacterium]